MSVVDDIRQRINKRRWERWRARQNKEREKSYCYWGEVPECGECSAIAGVGSPPETAMAAVAFSGEFKYGNAFFGKVEGYASSTAIASAWVNVTATEGDVIADCKNGRYDPNIGCTYIFLFYAEIYDVFRVLNTETGADYTCTLGVGRGLDIDEDTCTICCE